jgi:hypothetical protein
VKLSRTGASASAFVQSCEWQVMQVWVGRVARRGGPLYRIVTVPAVDAQLTGMMLVTERHGLGAGDPDPGEIVRAHEAADQQQGAAHGARHHDHRQPEVAVGRP